MDMGLGIPTRIRARHLGLKAGRVRDEGERAEGGWESGAIRRGCSAGLGVMFGFGFDGVVEGFDFAAKGAKETVYLGKGEVRVWGMKVVCAASALERSGHGQCLVASRVVTLTVAGMPLVLTAQLQVAKKWEGSTINKSRAKTP